MNRRRYLTTLAGGAILAGCGSAPAEKAAPAAESSPNSDGKPIELHVDLDVDPAREQEMLEKYRTVFHPAISRQPGFVSVTLLKLRDIMVGPGPGDAKYRLAISFETEDQRKTWVATDDHEKAWPTIEATLRGSKYTVILFDTV